MTAEILAATEHLVLRRMTNDDAAALAAYRSDPVQARYQSWETPNPLDSARALIAQMRNVRFAQPGVWLQTGIETSGRLIGDIAVRVDGDQTRQAPSGSPSPLTRKATGTPPKHYAQSSHCCSPSTTYTASHLDAGYDSGVTRDLLTQLGFDGEISRKGVPAPIQVGKRWVVERTHSWMNGYGKLRRCTDKNGDIVDFYLYLAAAFVTVRQLIQRARNRYRWDTRPTTRRLK